MANRVIERAYATIGNYVPEDARRILEEQIPRIEGYIDEELNQFRDELGAFAKSAIDQAVAEQQAEMSEAMTAAKTSLEAIRNDAAVGDDQLILAVSALEKQLNDLESHYTRLGEGVKTALVNGLRGAGIPLPG